VQKVYGYRLKTIEAWSERFGHPPAATLTRKDVKAFAKSMADKPEAAKSTIGLLRVLFGFAIDEGELQSNPATNMRMKSNPPRHQVWTEQQIDAVIAKAEEMGRPSIGLAVALAHNLGQREGDILHMTWGQFDGTKIRLKQRKTGALLEVDCTRQLLDVLAATPRTGTLMVIREETTNPHNGRRFPPRAYRADTFRGEFRLMAKAASIPDDLEFRDLRRTAVVRLAEAGCSVPEIAAISGHSIGVTTKIMDVYCPRTSVMAGHAITKLEEYRKRNTPATKLDA
jgi:integrase